MDYVIASVENMREAIKVRCRQVVLRSTLYGPGKDCMSQHLDLCRTFTTRHILRYSGKADWWMSFMEQTFSVCVIACGCTMGIDPSHASSYQAVLQEYAHVTEILGLISAWC